MIIDDDLSSGLSPSYLQALAKLNVSPAIVVLAFHYNESEGKTRYEYYTFLLIISSGCRVFVFLFLFLVSRFFRFFLPEVMPCSSVPLETGTGSTSNPSYSARSNVQAALEETLTNNSCLV